MADIHYHIERPGPRARYIARHLLGRMTGWEAKEVVTAEAFRAIEGPKLVYGAEAIPGSFHIANAGLLGRFGSETGEPALGSWREMPILFPSGPGDLPFDVFSASFFLITRYEEMSTIMRDRHERPLTAALHAARHGYLHRPIVDEWLIAMTDEWRRKDPRLPSLKRSYHQTATLDVDNGAMYKGRAWWRSMGGMVRDLLKGRPRRISDRISTLTGRSPDPYQVHDAFVELAKRHGARILVNFLVAPRGRYDHAIGPGHGFVRACMLAMDRRAEVGIHPSYASSERQGMIKQEKVRLEEVIGHPVAIGRQHFLRFRLPSTYRELERIGIREEHSMGLADRIGFRAGTCTPFPFYDLEAEAETLLMVQPFALMDSAMAYGMHLTPAMAIDEAKRIVDAVKHVEGTFISVWHERFLSDYGDEKGWGRVAEEVLNHARP